MSTCNSSFPIRMCCQLAENESSVFWSRWHRCILMVIAGTMSLGCSRPFADEMETLTQTLKTETARNELRDWARTTASSADTKSVMTDESVLPSSLAALFPEKTRLIVVNPETEVLLVQWGSGFGHFGVGVSIEGSDIPTDLFLDYRTLNDDLVIFAAE